MIRIRDVVETILFLALLGGSLVIYLVVSNLGGIIMIFSGLLMVGLLFLFTTPGLLAQVKYPKLVRYLQKYRIISESELSQKTDLLENYVHRGFYELSKVWRAVPLVIRVKNQYLFVHAQIMKKIIETLQKNPPNSAQEYKDLVTEIRAKYSFSTRLEAETVVKYVLDIEQAEI